MAYWRQRRWSLVHYHGRLWLGGCMAAVWLSVSPLQMAHAHDLSHQQHPTATATQEAGPEMALGRLVIPDVALVNQHGERVHFYRDLVKGRVVAINFIFTTCSTVCPVLGVQFSTLQELMGDRVGRDVTLISLSVDPVVDTPQRLKAWSERFDGGPGWTLLTGPKREVEALLKALHVFTPDKQAHTPTILIGNDATGTWRRTYGLVESAALADMLSEVISAIPAQEVHK
jgi:protein SCO1/2